MKKSVQRISTHLKISMLAGCMVLGQVFFGGSIRASEERKQLQRIGSYEELVKILKENNIITDKNRYFSRQYAEEAVNAPLNAVAESKTADSASSAVSYSETNIQVRGVDEADTLKNDNRYIYQKIGNDKIVIADTEGQLKKVSTIKAKENSGIVFNTMFLDKNQLIVVGERRETDRSNQLEVPIQEGKISRYQWERYKAFSVLQVYDISNKSLPKLTREIEMEGSLNEVRKVDHTVYIITDKFNNFILENQFAKEDILPLYKDTAAGNEQRTIMPTNIWYCPWTRAQSYTLMTAITLNDNTPLEVQGVLGATDKIYMNEKNLYLTSQSYEDGTGLRTYINKYAVDKQKLTYAASGHINGTLLNQFSMDEYEGNFRIAATDYQESAVYILDSQLKIIGSLEKLGPGERIYSVRFTGEKGYVVTFKQVDPLFVMDLSNPKAPKILGELKIPGFSQYLHPIGEDLVVGIGQSTADIITRDENGKETVTGVTTAGIKLSLFDVSNPMNPREVNHIILGTKGSYSGAAENHKMVTVHNEKHLLAIPIFIHFDEASNTKDFNGAYVFGIKDGKLVGKAKLGKVDSQYYGYYNNTDRVCYIGDKLYFLYDNKINEYKLNTYSRIQTLQLD